MVPSLLTSTSFVSSPFNKRHVRSGTYMMRNLDECDLMKAINKSPLINSKPNHIRILELKNDGSLRIDRSIRRESPFFLTGHAVISNSGYVVLIEVIPPDCFFGWIQLDSMFENDIDATINFWLTQGI